MAKKEFTYRGKSLEEIKNLSLNEFIEIIPARQRRSLKRGFTDAQKILIKKIRAGKKDVKTEVRDIAILPEMIGATIRVHRGNTFEPVKIVPEMLGHTLGEFTYNRKRVQHSAPGIGATRSSAAVSVK